MAKDYLDKNGLSYFWSKLKILIDKKVNSSDLATVATSGSYNDLVDKPTIPTIPGNVLTASSFSYQSYTVSVTVGAYTKANGTKAIKLAGYTPLCIAGFNPAASDGDNEHSLAGAWLSARGNGTGTITARAGNGRGNKATMNFTIYVLWVKN